MRKRTRPRLKLGTAWRNVTDPQTPRETVNVETALGRVLAEDMQDPTRVDAAGYCELLARAGDVVTEGVILAAEWVGVETISVRV